MIISDYRDDIKSYIQQIKWGTWSRKSFLYVSVAHSSFSHHIFAAKNKTSSMYIHDTWYKNAKMVNKWVWGLSLDGSCGGWGAAGALHDLRLLDGGRLVLQQQVWHVRIAQVVRVGRRDGRRLVVGRRRVLVLVLVVLMHRGRVGAQVGAWRKELPAQHTGHGLRRVQQAGRRRCGRHGRWVAAQHRAGAARRVARLGPSVRMVLCKTDTKNAISVNKK